MVDSAGHPDYTRGSILLIFTYRVAIGLILCGYGTFYVLRLRNERLEKNSSDKLTMTVSVLFLCSILTKLTSDLFAYFFVMDLKEPSGIQPIGHLYVIAIIGSYNRFFH